MKALVLGGGVVGVTTAYYLAKAGHEVAIRGIDDPRFGADRICEISGHGGKAPGGYRDIDAGDDLA